MKVVIASEEKTWLDKKIELFVKLDPNSDVETKYSFKLSKSILKIKIKALTSPYV